MSAILVHAMLRNRQIFLPTMRIRASTELLLREFFPLQRYTSGDFPMNSIMDQFPCLISSV